MRLHYKGIAIFPHKKHILKSFDNLRLLCTKAVSQTRQELKKPFIIFPFKKGFIEKILNFLMKF